MIYKYISPSIQPYYIAFGLCESGVMTAEEHCLKMMLDIDRFPINFKYFNVKECDCVFLCN